MTKRFEKKVPKVVTLQTIYWWYLEEVTKYFRSFQGRNAGGILLTFRPCSFCHKRRWRFVLCIVAHPNLATMEGTTLVFYDTQIWFLKKNQTQSLDTIFAFLAVFGRVMAAKIWYLASRFLRPTSWLCGNLKTLFLRLLLPLLVREQLSQRWYLIQVAFSIFLQH